MELKDIKIIGAMIPNILKIILEKDLSIDNDFHFVYGQEEYTRDLSKVKKQFKRQLRKTFKYGR